MHNVHQHEDHRNWLPIILGNLELFENDFALFILLGFLESSFVCPAQQFPTISAIDIGNCVQTGKEMLILFGPFNYVRRVTKQKGSPTASLQDIIKFNSTTKIKIIINFRENII